MPKIEQHNLRQMINNHFFDRDQTKEILENFVTVDNNSVLHVGLPEPANVALTTPNNAITTADVGTLKAKVTDANSNNCYGVPVDFVNRKTREVIGQGITDLNGEAFYNFRLEDSDIFSVQAKLSQDYLFHDGAILNNTASWGDLGNIVQEIYHDYTLIYKDDDSSDSLLYSPTLSGYTEISFMAKLVDAAANDSFCGIIETNSSGTVTGNLNGVTLSQLGLTSSSNGQWFKFYINVLGTDVLIKAVNVDTGAVSTASVTLSAAMSYFSFCFVLTGDLTSTYFSNVKINKCSDDLTMFVKDRIYSGWELLLYDIGISSNHTDIYASSSSVDITRTSDYTSLTKSNSASTTADLRINTNIPLESYIEFDIKVIGSSSNGLFARWIQNNNAMTGISLDDFNENLNIWHHCLLKINNNGTMTCIMDDKTYTAPATNFSSNISYIQFIFRLTSNSPELQFKNFNIFKTP